MPPSLKGLTSLIKDNPRLQAAAEELRTTGAKVGGAVSETLKGLEGSEVGHAISRASSAVTSVLDKSTEPIRNTAAYKSLTGTGLGAPDQSESAEHGEGDQSDDWETESEAEGSENEDGIKIPKLLPVPDTLAKPNDSLCDICRALDLTPERFVVLPSDNEGANKPDDPNIQLGLVEDIKKKSHCPFCRLVIVALGPGLPSHQDGKPVSVTMSWNTDGPSPNPNTPWHHIPQIRVLRPYAQTPGGGFVNREGLSLFPEITMLANDAPTPAPKSFFVRFINDQVDFRMVRNWLSMCETWHGSDCNKSEMLDHELEDPAKDIPHFRLIDVVDNCIIPAPSHCKYVALSYVWGRIDPLTILRTVKENVAQLERPGALLRPEYHDKIPLTIRDAMQVVKKLNMRYLWVDSLCIVQDDVGPGGSKMGSISKMDIVYGGAYLTIMAASGVDANAGLPGLWPGTRKTTQPIEEVLPGLRLAFKPKYQDYIPDANYYTRAWTYQEQRFTKRSLVFIGGQVIYRCMRADQWREDVFFEDQRNGGRTRSDRKSDDVGQFEGLIQSYSGLSLTFDSDIYHAFAGMTRYFKTELKANLVHGIPDAYFDWFLLWISLAPQKRRVGTPSWSWSGWIGQSWPNMWNWYNRSLPGVRKAIRKRTWIIWYQRRAHDSEECVRVWTPKKNSSSSSSPRNFYGGDVQPRFSFDCSQTLPTRRRLLGAPEYFEDTHNPTPGSGFLQFWTVSVMFKVDEPTSEDNVRGPRNTRSRLGIFGRDGRELGIVFVNPEWSKDNVPKTHEFILLCEGRDVRAQDGKVDQEEGWKYKMMLIEWHGDLLWAERVSLGSIEKQDLNQALGSGPVWKEIILG